MSAKTAIRRAQQEPAAATGSALNAVLVEPARGAAKGTGNPFLLVVGYSLLLVLVYLLVARRPVIASIQGLAQIGQTAAEAWVKPVDPLQALGASAPAGSAPGAAAGGGAAAPEPAIAAGAIAPAPSQLSTVKSIRGRIPPAKTLEAVLRLRTANQKLIAAHRLTAAQAVKREERLVPRSVYPGFYSADLFPGVPRLTPLGVAG